MVTIISETLPGLLAAVASYAGYVLINFIRAKTEELKRSEELKGNQAAAAALESAEKALCSVAGVTVGKIEELFAKDIRKQIAEGIATKEDLIELANMAYLEIINTVKPEVIKQLESCVGSAETYVRNLIETQLTLLKSKQQNGG